MPDELQPQQPATPDVFKARDFITEMNKVIATCSAALQTTDLRGTEDAVRQSRAIYKDAEKAGYDFMESLQILKLLVQVLANNAQMIAYQIEARFAEAITKGNAVLMDSVEALQIINKQIEKGEIDSETLLARLLLEYYNTLGNASVAHIKAEQIAFTGNLDDYRTALLNASALFKKVETLDYSDNSIVTTLYFFCLNMAERLANRARYFEYIQREQTNRYINPQGKTVFIIHGHSGEAANSLQQLLKDEFKLESVILKNEANSGDSVIEKFESHACDCGYAFAIITSDDRVENDSKEYFQARPNVMFELGWFYGRYGRSRVCLLKQEGTQIPSDMGGIISLEFDKEINKVSIDDIRKELQAVGMI